MGLKEYHARRNFVRTSEPKGRLASRSAAKGLRFVVQKHDATRLHYDFRLEMEGVLKSWAVPKGFPVKRGEPHLAVQVEDHPLEYGKFEGTIPEGSYGAGTVMLWDAGTYEVFGGDPLGSLNAGKLHFELAGKKLKGEWALVRMRQRPREQKPQWLLLKSGDDIPAFSKPAENRSVQTGRSMEQIAAGKKEWHTDQPAPRSKRLAGTRTAPRIRSGNRAAETTPLRGSPARLLPPKLPAAKPGFVAPMKALPVNVLPTGTHWLYEIKFDGVRALVIKNGRVLSLLSRAAKDLSEKYPELIEELRKLPVEQALLDGEVVAVDAQGRPSFQLLQSYQSSGAAKPPLFYYVFDVLNVDGHDLKGLPLSQRKSIAQALVRDVSPMLRFSAGIDAGSTRVMREMQARGLEGLVAKDKASLYQPGQRTGAWKKFKWNAEQEFVIGGYTRPKGGRQRFGAILVGYYQSGRLLFAGKVGTGFDERLLDSLYDQFQPLVRRDCPFKNLPEDLPGNSRGLTAAEMKKCTWLKPELVCQVRFTEWTRDNHLRQPVFLGPREDKDPARVRRETAAPAETVD